MPGPSNWYGSADAKLSLQADLVAAFQAALSAEQIATHRIAAHNLIEIKDDAFRFIAESLKNGKSITEYDVVQFVLRKLTRTT